MKRISSRLFTLLGVSIALSFLTGCPKEPGLEPIEPIANEESVVTVSVPDFVPGKTSIEQAKNMGMGWNLGNTLDAGGTNDWSYTLGLGTETFWGMPKTTQAMIKAIRAAGFKTIRIPVSWHNHISRSDKTNYKIDSAWMNRVKTIVDWSLDEGMCVILNVHHDNMKISEINSNPGFALSSDAEVQAKSKAYLDKVWTQIATTFADYGDNLVFEVLNEPIDVGGEWTENEWWCNNSSVFACITDYEQTCVNAIRKTGGNNATRYLMVPGYAASGSDSGMLKMYTMPKDTASDKLILSAHAYSPYAFAMNNMSDTTFGSDDASSLTTLFNYLNSAYIKKGIGVVMGEASATDKNNLEERVKWTKDYYRKATAIGIPVVLWDNMVLYKKSQGDDVGENHGYFNRNKRTWYYPAMIKTMVKEVYGIDMEENNTEKPGNKDPEDNPSNPDNTSGENLLSAPLDLTDWNINNTIPAAKFSSTSDSTKLVFTYEQSSENTEGYMNLKLQDGEWKEVFTAGVITNALKGDGVFIPSGNSGTITYAPTASEWALIKNKGLIVYGYGIKITKITLQ